MAEFIAEDNACGQNLLQLVAVGNAIVAELLRLKDYIPDVFWYEISKQLCRTLTNIKQISIFRLKKVDGKNKFADIVFDFSYFEKLDANEKRIEDDPVRQAI